MAGAIVAGIFLGPLRQFLRGWAQHLEIAGGWISRRLARADLGDAVRDLVAEEGAVLAVLRPLGARQSPQIGVGTQNGPRYTLRFCRAFDGAHLAKRSERGGWRIGIGPEVIAGEIDMLPTER